VLLRSVTHRKPITSITAVLLPFVTYLLALSHNMYGVGSYSLGTGAVSPGLKRKGHGTRHSPPSSAEVKNGEAIPPLPSMSSWRSA
jgi:hypothetical protein